MEAYAVLATGGKQVLVKVGDTVSSPERLAKKLKDCERFEKRKKAIYRMLNENSDGNAVRVEEFFRMPRRR